MTAKLKTPENRIEITHVLVKDLNPFEKNPRINEGAIDKVTKSIEAHGFNQPLVIDQNNRICVGHSRFYAAKRLELEVVPVYKKEMSEAQFIAYNLADNKTHDYSKWDEDLLKENLLELQDLDSELLDSTTFEDSYIDDLLSDMAEGFEDLTNDEKFENKEIQTENYGKSQIMHKCPECGFEFTSDKNKT